MKRIEYFLIFDDLINLKNNKQHYFYLIYGLNLIYVFAKANHSCRISIDLARSNQKLKKSKKVLKKNLI